MADPSDPPATPATAFPERLRARRKELGLSHGVLAKDIGTTRQTISAWEAGRHRPSDLLMPKLADRLELTIDELSPGWTPEEANHGGRRTAAPPTTQRLDALEAEVAALRQELVAAEVLKPRVTFAPGLAEVAERHEARSAGRQEKRSGPRKKAQGS